MGAPYIVDFRLTACYGATMSVALLGILQNVRFINCRMGAYKKKKNPPKIIQSEKWYTPFIIMPDFT